MNMCSTQRDLEAARLRNARLMERVAALEMALASAQQLIATAMAPAGSDAAEFQKGEVEPEFNRYWPPLTQNAEPYALKDGEPRPWSAWFCARCKTTWSKKPSWQCRTCGEPTVYSKTISPMPGSVLPR